MAYELVWEPLGVYRRYFGDVTIAERLRSFEQICSDRRFDGLRYAITNYLEVADYELTTAGTEEIAALHTGPLMINGRIRIAAVAVRPDVVGAIQEFIAHGYTAAPYRVFATIEEARNWVNAIPPSR